MIAFAIGYVISWIFFNTKTATFWNEIFVKVENEMQYGIQDTARIISGIGGFVIFMASIFTDYLVKSLFFLAPYLLETKKVCGLQVIHLSLATIKGHMKEVFKLQAHYYIYIVLFSCLYFLINQTTRFIFLAPILSIGLVVVEVHLYRMEYVISKAQLFQKIMNEGKEL